jgi:uncharacterized membrane protein YbhN (UPF0104 family)
MFSDQPFPEIMTYTMVSVFYGFILPGSWAAGEAVKAYRIGRKSKDTAGATSGVLIDQAIGNLIIPLPGCAAWLFFDQPLLNAMALALWLFLLGSLVVCVLPAFLDLPGAASRFAGRVEPARLKGWILWFAQLTAKYRENNRNWAAIGLAVAFGVTNQLLQIGIYVLIGWSLGIDFSPFTLAWVLSCLAVISTIPVSVAGVGVSEVSLVYFMESLGYATDAVVSLTLLILSIRILGAFSGFLFDVKARRSEAMAG